MGEGRREATLGMVDGPRKPRRVRHRTGGGPWRVDILAFTDIDFARGLAEGYLHQPRDWQRCREIIAEHGIGFIAAVASVIAAVASVTTVVLVALD